MLDVLYALWQYRCKDRYNATEAPSGMKKPREYNHDRFALGNFMKIISEKITFQDLREMAANTFGDMVKGVVDVDRELIALDAELHADLETCLLEDGSQQDSLWGINVYPDLSGDDFVEFDSIINMRPSQGNRSRGVEDERIRTRIYKIISRRIVQ